MAEINQMDLGLYIQNSSERSLLFANPNLNSQAAVNRPKVTFGGCPYEASSVM